ncbi:MAG: TIGR04283 family arsenosugar biosynthesis glycosyltransferase [Flavobacteriaceae bacterium]
MRQNKERKKLSIIIPVLNEEAYVGNILRYLKTHCTSQVEEIIVVDGGSTDKTIAIAQKEGAKVLRSKPGRAVQLNFGAQNARGDILYFLHVDTFPPAHFEKAILNAVSEDYNAGCFQMRFDNNSRFLNFFAWFTRVNHRLCRGGDQSLFIDRELFDQSGGFDENFRVYEDTEFIIRISKSARFKILPQMVITSARKYEQIGMFRLQYHFGVIHLKHMFGAGPEQLHNYYQRHIAS